MTPLPFTKTEKHFFLRIGQGLLRFSLSTFFLNLSILPTLDALFSLPMRSPRDSYRDPLPSPLCSLTSSFVLTSTGTHYRVDLFLFPRNRFFTFSQHEGDELFSLTAVLSLKPPFFPEPSYSRFSPGSAVSFSFQRIAPFVWTSTAFAFGNLPLPPSRSFAPEPGNTVSLRR